MIVQEIFDPKYTGIAQKISDGYIIELAKGHFVPKGLVTTSRYVTSLDGKLLYSEEVSQDKCFKILEGHVLEERMNLKESLVSVPMETLLQIIRDFEPFLRNETTAVEFGILEDVQKGRLRPYLIDFVEDKSVATFQSETVCNGVISNGTITGKLMICDLDSLVQDPLNFHFHDTIDRSSDADDSYVIYCKMPDIRLHNIISKYNANKIGFVFEEGSLLCHLAIILREQGIPAVVTRVPDGIAAGAKVTIDALTPGLSSKERVYQT